MEDRIGTDNDEKTGKIELINSFHENKILFDKYYIVITNKNNQSLSEILMFNFHIKLNFMKFIFIVLKWSKLHN